MKSVKVELRSPKPSVGSIPLRLRVNNYGGCGERLTHQGGALVCGFDHCLFINIGYWGVAAKRVGKGL